MNLGQLALAVAAFCLLALPRRVALVTFLAAVLLIPRGAQFAVGSLAFLPLRILVIVGLFRIIMRREWPVGFPQNVDRAMIAFALVLLVSSFFHNEPTSEFIYRAGLSLEWVGAYFVMRSLVGGWANVRDVFRCFAWVMLILGFAMFWEQVTGKNLFGFLGARPEIAMRNDRFRASGPFAHAILAGTVAALWIPPMFSMWRTNKFLAKIGLIGCFVAVFASFSSGPLMTAVFVCAALWLWRYQGHLKRIVRSSVAILILLHIVMKAPVWYLIARIDLTGGSTGYHRARLIDAGIEHLNEWWKYGTDFTRHWMPTGVSWSVDHTDITNYYLGMGVRGGLPLMLIFIWALVGCFKQLTATWRSTDANDKIIRFEIWAFGASMFGNLVTMISVAYFDQSSVMVFGFIGLICSGCCALRKEQNDLVYRSPSVIGDSNPCREEGKFSEIYTG